MAPKYLDEFSSVEMRVFKGWVVGCVGQLFILLTLKQFKNLIKILSRFKRKFYSLGIHIPRQSKPRQRVRKSRGQLHSKVLVNMVLN